MKTAPVASLALALVAAAGCETQNPPPKLEVVATWMTRPGPTGCDQHRLHLDIATVAFATVSARGTSAKADEHGHTSLELSRAQVASHDRLRVSVAGGKTEIVVPARAQDARPLELGVEPAAASDPVVWRGLATGAVVGGRLATVVGVVDGAALRFRFVGCDLKGGTTAGGTVVGVRFADPYTVALPDAIDVRVPLAARLAAATATPPHDEPLVVDVENADGRHGRITLTGALDVAAAQAALTRAP